MSKVVPFIASNLNLLKDKAFLEFLNSNQLDDSTANELKGPVHQPSTEKPVLRYQPPSEKNQRISSLRPNAALLWALIDDSPLNAEEHEKAVDIMKAWNPNYPNPIPATPWKGMIWRGEVGQDRMWDGSQWVDHPMEEAQGFKALLNLEDPKYSIEQIAAKVGKSPAYCAARVRLTELAAPMVEAFYAEEIGVGHA